MKNENDEEDKKLHCPKTDYFIHSCYVVLCKSTIHYIEQQQKNSPEPKKKSKNSSKIHISCFFVVVVILNKIVLAIFFPFSFRK